MLVQCNHLIYYMKTTENSQASVEVVAFSLKL